MITRLSKRFSIGVPLINVNKHDKIIERHEILVLFLECWAYILTLLSGTSRMAQLSALLAGRTSTPRKVLGTHFCYETEYTPGPLNADRMITSLENSPKFHRKSKPGPPVLRCLNQQNYRWPQEQFLLTLNSSDLLCHQDCLTFSKRALQRFETSVNNSCHVVTSQNT